MKPPVSWLLHRTAWVDAWRTVCQHRVFSWCVVGVIGSVVALPVALVGTVIALSGWVQTDAVKPRITLLLEPHIPRATCEALAVQWRGLGPVHDVRYVSPESVHRAVGVLSESEQDLWPQVLQVLLKTDTSLHHAHELAARFRAYREVHTVSFDPAWLSRWTGMARCVWVVSSVISCLLLLSVVLIMMHSLTTRLQDIRADRDLMVWMGADKAYLRRPFLYLGLLYGMGGGLVALVLHGGIMGVSRGALHHAAYVMGAEVPWLWVWCGPGVGAVLGTGMLGWCAAWWVMAWELRGV